MQTEEIDGKNYQVWNWKHHTMLHYVINPGLVINELVLGQRAPRAIYFDLDSDKPLMERQYVRCPHCQTMHDGRTWSVQNKNAFKNWFGLYCPSCGEIIPCLRNYTSWLVLAITYPLWFWWIDRWKQSWLAKQPARFENISLELTHQNVKWWKTGLYFGGFMYIIMTLLIPFMADKPLTLDFALISLPIWASGGLGFALIMKYWMGKKVKST